MFKKSFYFSFLLSLAMLVLVAPAKATETQIATLDITTTNPSPGNFTELVSVSNLTSTTLNFQSYLEYFTLFPSNPPIGPISYVFSVGPFATDPNSFGCGGTCNTVAFTLSGSLTGLDFSIGGQNFEATTLGFTTPQFSGDFNGSVPVTIDATLVSTTPEPASIMLFGTGLLGIMLLLRKGSLA